jgi:Flp pilus assembly protein TadD
MNRTAALIAALALLAGCGVQRRAAAPSWTGSRETMMRQVANAWDAGEGDFELRRLRQQVAADPSDLAARLALAEAYRNAGAPELALEHVRAVRPSRPSDSDLALLEARLWEQTGLPERGLEAAGEFARSHPASPDLLLWIGVTRDRRGEWKDAEAAHRAALAASGGSAAARNNLGYNLLLQGRADDAVAELQEAVRLAPGAGVARNNLALALARRGHPGDRDRAFQLWRDAQGSVAAHNNLAAVLLEQGKYAEARQQLSASLGRQRDFVPALRNLQLVAERDGGPASVPVNRRRSPWVTWAANFGRFLIGTEESGAHSTGAAGTGSSAR